jgi:hypothetical protein
VQCFGPALARASSFFGGRHGVLRRLAKAQMTSVVVMMQPQTEVASSTYVLDVGIQGKLRQYCISMVSA